jgi:hypothetical protein
MTPRFTGQDAANGAVRKAGLSGELHLAHSSGRKCLTNLTNRRSGRPGILVGIANTPATFGKHIAIVVSIGSEKEVRRIHALAGVAIRAVMANEQAIRDRTMRQFPSNAMRARSLAISSDGDNSVSPFGLFSGPQPAGFGTAGTIDLLPEAGLALHPMSSPSTEARAEAPTPIDHARMGNRELFPAALTETVDVRLSRRDRLRLCHCLTSLSGQVRRHGPGRLQRRRPLAFPNYTATARKQGAL